MRQPTVKLNKKPSDDPTAVPDFKVAAAKLLEKVEQHHAGCVEVAEAAKAAHEQQRAAAAGSSSDVNPDVLQAMMQLEAAKVRATIANEAAILSTACASRWQLTNEYCTVVLSHVCTEVTSVWCALDYGYFREDGL